MQRGVHRGRGGVEWGCAEGQEVWNGGVQRERGWQRASSSRRAGKQRRATAACAKGRRRGHQQVPQELTQDSKCAQARHSASRLLVT